MPERSNPDGPFENAPTRFSSEMPVIVLARPAGTDEDWREVDRGPGYFSIPAGNEIRVRIKGINDADLTVLANELQDVVMLRFLDLSENRNVTDSGLERLKALKMLEGLNLSSVTITNRGLDHLRGLNNLEHLNLSYCNKLTDAALKTLEAMRNLAFVDLKGCPGITNGGLARIRRRTLTVVR